MQLPYIFMCEAASFISFHQVIMGGPFSDDVLCIKIGFWKLNRVKQEDSSSFLTNFWPFFYDLSKVVRTFKKGNPKSCGLNFNYLHQVQMQCFVVHFSVICGRIKFYETRSRSMNFLCHLVFLELFEIHRNTVIFNLCTVGFNK